MKAPLLHIIQTELSQIRTKQFIEALGESDVVVVVREQASLIKALESVSHEPAYALYDADSEEVSALKQIRYAKFVDLIAQCAQSRSW